MADDVNPTAGENEDLVVNLDEEDNPGATQQTAAGSSREDGKPPPVPSPSRPPPSQEGLAELNRQVEAERAERVRVTQVAQQIARERDQAVAFAQEAERRGVSTYELYNENQIKAVQDKMVALSNGAEQAMVDGDFKRAQALNLEIGRLGGNLAVLERDQAILVQQRENADAQAQQRARQPPPQPQRPAQPTDPLERALQGKTEAAKAFIRRHPDIVRSDGTIKRVALDAHERALDEGHQADSAGYFEYIERSIMAQQPQNGGGNPPPRGAPTTAAPVARGSVAGGGGGGGGGTFVMTAKMRRLAEEQGVEPREWARNYVRLLAEGRITPIT
jgi:hypothetical protein